MIGQPRPIATNTAGRGMGPEAGGTAVRDAQRNARHGRRDESDYAEGVTTGQFTTRPGCRTSKPESTTAAALVMLFGS